MSKCRLVGLACLMLAVCMAVTNQANGAPAFC